MNVEIGTEAARFPEKDYIHGIFIAVLNRKSVHLHNIDLGRMRLENGKRGEAHAVGIVNVGAMRCEQQSKTIL
jgi:hypothetical protein